MKYKLIAFIDNYDELTLLCFLPKYQPKHYYLCEQDEVLEEIKPYYSVLEHDMTKLGFKIKSKLNLHQSYIILDDLYNSIPVYSGSVVRQTLFESEFYYDGMLGFDYRNHSTVFRVWSPVASSIFIELRYPKGRKEKRELQYLYRGVWETEIEGDLEGVAYVYHVKIFDTYKHVLDPYGLSTTADGKYNYVIDTDKLYKFKYPKPHFSGFYTDAVIYEVSVRDLALNTEGPQRGCFLGLISQLDYIASLGVTHIQLMPVFEFGGIDKMNRDKEYNWGYNPEQYFIPSGHYASDPNDPYTRINELLMLIDEAHKRGLRVILDVVFNHVYDISKHPFELLVPGYFFRVDSYGNNTNVSGCGNDLATEKRMCSRFIIENLLYWVKKFRISGFRFDLMGLMDIETLNNAYLCLKHFENDLMLYGEGWNMPNTIPDAFRPHSYNHFKIPNYAFFNDRFRDVIKGSQWDNSFGFVFGNTHLNEEVYKLISGSCIEHYKFQNPNQTINYVECHDNYTLFDFATKKLGLSENQAIAGGRLALQIIAVSLGIVFIHAGQEFYRTKQGVENSYNAGDEVNAYDLKRRELYADDIAGLRELLALRKEYSVFRMTNVFEIERRMHYVANLSFEGLLCYVIDGDKYRLTIAIKNVDRPIDFVLPNSTLLFNGRRKVFQSLDKYVLDTVGVYIFKELKL